MPKETINPPELFPSLQYGFSQVVTAGQGQTVYLSGQVAWDADQRIVGPGDLRVQTRQALENVRTAMAAAVARAAPSRPKYGTNTMVSTALKARDVIEAIRTQRWLPVVTSSSTA